MQLQRRTLLCAAGMASAWLAAPALAQTAGPPPPEVAAELPNAQATGTTRMRFFGLDIYDARLWVGTGFRAASYAQYPLALELTYLRTLSGRAIAERSLKEMRRLGSIAAAQEQRWLAAMEEIFPDVKNTDRITGLHLPATGSRFWLNGQMRGTIADAEFSRLFFGIWLSDATSEPRLRAELLARAAP